MNQIIPYQSEDGRTKLDVRLDDSRIIESEGGSPGVVLDFNEDNQVVGIEMLHLSRRSPQLNLRELQYQTA